MLPKTHGRCILNLMTFEMCSLPSACVMFIGLLLQGFVSCVYPMLVQNQDNETTYMGINAIITLKPVKTEGKRKIIPLSGGRIMLHGMTWLTCARTHLYPPFYALLFFMQLHFNHLQTITLLSFSFIHLVAWNSKMKTAIYSTRP